MKLLGLMQKALAERAYELHTAIHLEDSEREGEYVSRQTLQTRESVRYHLDS